MNTEIRIKLFEIYFPKEQGTTPTRFLELNYYLLVFYYETHYVKTNIDAGDHPILANIYKQCLI